MPTFTNSLILHDARRLTEIITPARPCVSTTITSPPYWNLKDYGVKGQIGFGQDKEEYLNDVELVLKNTYRITKSTGSLWLVIDDYRQKGVLQLLPWEIAGRAQKAGWILRDIIIWDKQHSVPWHMRGQMRNVIEFILFFTKTNRYKYELNRIKALDDISKWWIDFPERFSPKGKTPTNIWSIPLRTQGVWRRLSKMDHHCPFPSALVARILELTTDPNDLVLDPFAGSGVVLAQAAAMGRSYVGFEINKKYVQMFHATVKKEVESEWEQLLEWRKKSAKANGYFEQTVMKLRALKYTRQVTKPFVELKDLKVEAFVCVASIPKHYRKKEPLELKILIVVNHQHKKFNLALKKALERAAHAPLSQYEVAADVEIVTKTALSRKRDLMNKRFYLYPEYKPRRHMGANTLKSWLSQITAIREANQSKVPMFANTAVDVAWAFEN
jgi:DNA modification methylase